MVCRGAIRTGRDGVAQPSHTGSPTCRRLAPDFALFPSGYQVSFLLSSSAHPKARSRPHRTIVLADDTLGGHEFTSCLSDTRIQGRVRPAAGDDGFSTQHETLQCTGKSARGLAAHPQRRAIARPPPVLQSASSGPSFSRHYPVGSHPTAFADGSLEQPRERRPPVRRFACHKFQATRGAFGSGRERRLNLRP